MKRKALVTIIVVVVIAVLVVLWRSYSVQSVASSDDPAADSPQALEAKIKVTEQKKGAPLTQDEQIALLPQAMATLARKASRMDAEDVSFYAKVVDQYGQPVADAFIRTSVMGSMLGGYTPGTGHTNASGQFRISATGAGITILAIQKPGYIFSAADCYGRDICGFSETDYFAAADKQRHEKTWYDHKTPDTAYTFKMHKLGYIDGVITGSVFTLAPRNGSEWQTYMFSPYKKRSDEQGAPGQLRARLLDRSEDNWKIEIQAVNGGIQLAAKDDAYMSIAPESGYQDTFVFECKRDGNCNARNNRRFYFYSNGGKEYGAMVVGITRGMSGRYRINTNGGRDLNMADIQQFDLNGNYR